MNGRFDIIIAGGGMAGLSMALACAHESLSVAVVESTSLRAQHLPAFDGRVSAISYGSKLMLARLGAWEGMRAHAEPILDIRVSDGHSPFFLDYHHEDVGAEPFGWIVENSHTRQALFDALTHYPNVSLFENARIAAIKTHANYAWVELSSGEKLTAGLLIGAEGKFSKLRELAGIQAHQTEYKQTAIVCTIAHTLPHDGVAQERFLARGPFAVLPMIPLRQASGGQATHRSSLVWVEPSHLAPHYLTLPKEEMEQEITERVGMHLGEIRLAGKVFSYPLGLSVASRFTAERLVLIGDAAHAIHPIAGQGINLGFRDVAVLHDILARYRKSGFDIGGETVRKEYERWRRLDTLSMVAVTDGLTRLFSNRSGVLKLARGLGLYGVSNMMPLKKFFMRHAMGTVGDLPTLMRQ